MTSSLTSPRLRADCMGSRVASYRSLRGAALAVQRLVDRGFPPEAVHVQPRELAAVEGALAHVPTSASRRLPLSLAALGAVVVAFLGGLSLTGLAAATVVFGVVAASATAGVRMYRVLFSAHTRRAASLIHADRFDVVATRRAAEANHILATWWDPEARPARVRSRHEPERLGPSQGDAPLQAA